MDLFLNCLVVFTINSSIICVYRYKGFLNTRLNNLKFKYVVEKSQFILNEIQNRVTYNEIDSLNISNESFKNFETKRLQDLSLERIQLNNKLKMLEFITTFEMYLHQNNVDRNRFDQFNEFNELKLSAQRSILESTKKVSTLSAA